MPQLVSSEFANDKEPSLQRWRRALRPSTTKAIAFVVVAGLALAVLVWGGLAATWPVVLTAVALVAGLGGVLAVVAQAQAEEALAVSAQVRRRDLRAAERHLQEVYVELRNNPERQVAVELAFWGQTPTVAHIPWQSPSDVLEALGLADDERTIAALVRARKPEDAFALQQAVHEVRSVVLNLHSDLQRRLLRSPE
jgi:hypothetical protein